MSSFTAGLKVRTPFQIDQTDLLGPVANSQTAFEDGVVETLQVVVQRSVTGAGGTLRLQVGGVDVPGLSIAIPINSPKGTVFTAFATRGTDAQKVTKGTHVSVVPAGFTGAGAVNGHFTVGTQNNPAAL